MTEKEAQQKLSDEIYRITKPIFEKVLKETLPDSMTITKKPYRCAWRPNNWRRQIEVKLKTNSAIERVKSTIDPTNKRQISIAEHTKLVSWKNYHPNITIQYGKTSLVGIYNQERDGNEKRYFEITGESTKELEDKIDTKKDEINAKIDAALMDFAKQFDIKIPFVRPKQIRGEDGIKGDDFLDSLPDNMIIHDTIFKKVYKDCVEFKSGKDEIPSIVRAKTYIKNRALEEFSPEICKEIDTTHEEIKTLATQIQYFAENINSHIPVYLKIAENTDKNTKSIQLLSHEIKALSKALSRPLLKPLSDHDENQTQLNKWR